MSKFKDNRYSEEQPIQDGPKFAYLLRGIGFPLSEIEKDIKKHKQIVMRAGKEMGIKIKILPFNGTHSDSVRYAEKRYFFRFPYFRRDDRLAQRVSESIVHAMSILHGPFYSEDYSGQYLYFRAPSQLVWEKNSVSLDELVKVEESRSPFERSLDIPTGELHWYVSTTLDVMNAVWRAAPVIFRCEKIARATLFLKSSQDSFHIWTSQIREVLREPGLIADTAIEQVRLETALQNSFKAIEAIIGDPPNDDRKFFHKIREIGLDPFEELGWSNKLPLYQWVRKMNESRDKKAAHGSTSNREITYIEMIEYQSCARHIILSMIEGKRGSPLYD